MPTFEFTVALDRAPADDDFDRLFDAGLDDTTPETRDGRGVLNVAREAASMSAAIVSVARDAASAGFRVVDVVDDDLVSLKTVAQRTGRSYESVRLLATGKRGPGGFPGPLSGDGWALYSWALVSEWFAESYGAGAAPAVSPDQRVLAAAALMLRAAETAGPAAGELVELVAPAAARSTVPDPSKERSDAVTFLTGLSHPLHGPLIPVAKAPIIFIADSKVQPDLEAVKSDPWFLDAGTAASLASLSLCIRVGWGSIPGVRVRSDHEDAEADQAGA
ncbi:hypothetical protein [Frigoribacterium sp. CFBP 13707]|uniref:hypothetical protein n=1 Tax=Frigoribacterium sp. CFBP 13707 TaxID=2775313 RepID=UPI001783C53D|nr:hypothetical protein [Frigoribacterium sp. CFBP 13707]MBD8729341.1 hypothetical protein [Frigoribacterium sp. CFBP 13707]